jgi:LysM repeat protein
MGLSDLFDGLGEISKLTIITYEDKDFLSELGDEFVVMYNPNTFNRNYKSVWLPDKTISGAGEDKKFRRLESDSVSFEFLFDGTGVSYENVNDFDASDVEFVQDQIDEFLDITRTINGDTHEPNYLELSWGNFIFQGVMESATVNYKLFHSSGAPLRATINANFKESVPQKEQVKKTGKKSPDLTHIRVVKSGESLPMIAKKVYGDPSLYLEIAKINNLQNFRDLSVGMQLVLPPINKEVNG